MASENIYRIIKIDEQSITPKYIQLTNSVLYAIGQGKLEKDYLLPSINELSYELDIARDTVEKAYRNLKKLGVIGSVPGKGYFIAKTDFKQAVKVFLLFNKLSAPKQIIYDSFASTLGEKAAIDFYIYNNNFSLFKKLLQNKNEDYTHCVIIPHFLEGGENAADVINEKVNSKLILLDKLIPGIKKEYGAVYESFEKDIYNSLKEALPQLSKYSTINIIFPENTYHPKEIITGFTNFCYDYAFNHKVIHHIKNEEIKKGEVYINLMEDDLVTLIEKILHNNYKMGEEVGVISYNETAIKKIILNGITTISADFKMVGEKAAELILTNSVEQVEADFHLTMRNSL